MRVGSAAVAFALKEHKAPSRFWRSAKGHGLCLQFARTALDVPAKYGSAVIAWSHVARADRHGGVHPPPGVPVFWRIGAFGHVAVSAGGGYVWSTDILHRGRVDKVRISYLTARWGATYLGWAETLNDRRVYTGTAKVPRQVTVHVRNIQASAEHDPAAPAGSALHPHEVGVVEKALAAEGLLDDRFLDGSWGTKTVAAWRKWQRRIGNDPSGHPGADGLKRLGARHGFPVAA
jgi:hypothetical protein